MAISKIIGSGLGTINSPVEFTSADNLAQITLTSTDADAVSGPNINLYRNSGSPADNDHLGEIRFTGRNDNSQDVVYANIETRIKDASDGTEDGYFDFETMIAGTLQSRLIMNETATVFNEDSLDLDFRVESNGNANMLFVDGGNNRVGIGTAAPEQSLHVNSAGDNITAKFESSDAGCFIVFEDSASTSDGNRLQVEGDTIVLATANATALKIDATGAVTKPLQPAFSVNKGGTNQNNLAVGADVIITFDTERFDNNADFDLTNNRFVAPVTGKYQLSLTIRLENLDSAAAYYIPMISTSNQIYRFIFDPDFGQDTPYWAVTISVLADMDASDTATITFNQGAGTAQTDASGDDDYTFFTGYLVC